MPRHPRRRSGATVALLATALAVVLVIAACDAGSSAPSPTPADPGPAIDTPALVGDPGRDGQVVRVGGFFLATGGRAVLCDAVMESYPPQCGGTVVRLIGEVPQAVLDALESTAEPDLAQATWGGVEVVGTYRASGADGQPTIEIASIEVVGAGE